MLTRASHYVADYEAQLGNLIGEEVYVQTPEAQKKLRTQSDFAILQVGKEWVGMRDVRCVDGTAVERKGADFQTILSDSPAAILKALDDISAESSRYNIGPVQRTTNLPTFALRVLRQHNAPHFEFKKTGENNDRRCPNMGREFSGGSDNRACWECPRTGTGDGPRQ